MKPNSILYYPHIEFKNEAWVKSSLLLWDHVYRIVPDGYTPEDSYEIKALIDEGLVRNIKLDEKDRRDTADEFLNLCGRIEKYMPAGLSASNVDRIHPDKIDTRLYPFLDSIGDHFIDDEKWLHMSKELARGYMFKLSQVVARIRNLYRGTDDFDAWSINPYFCENGNFGDLLNDPDSKGFLCSLTLEDVVPENIGGVSAKDLITFVKNRRDERSLLREKFDDLTNHLAKISNLQHAGQINEDFISELNKSKEQYRKSMDSWKDVVARSITVGVPVSVTTWDKLKDFDILPNNRNDDLIKIAGSIVVGAICTFLNFGRVKTNRTPSYSSYLIDLDNMCKNVAYSSYIRLDEFIND